MIGDRRIPVDARPITRVRAGSCGQVLVSRRVAAYLAGRNPELVSRHCAPVACDVANRALLYDADSVNEVLERLPRRARKASLSNRLHA